MSLIYVDHNIVQKAYVGLNLVRKIYLGTNQVFPSYKRVGGRIFYIDSNSTGATYTFYDSSENIITDQSISGLVNAYYYKKSGTSSSDKFYVYDNTSHIHSGIQITEGLSSIDFYWGHDNVSIESSERLIGQGKTNSKNVVSYHGVPTDRTPNVWWYIQNCCNANNLNGCSDWYIACQEEAVALKDSGLVDWFDMNETFIWSSTVGSSGYGSFYYYTYSTVKSWLEQDRRSGDFPARCFACRSF